VQHLIYNVTHSVVPTNSPLRHTFFCLA